MLSKGNLAKRLIVCLTIILPLYVSAEEFYSSELANISKQADSNGYKLVKSKSWPNSSCLVDTGKDIVYPGETATLKIRKSEECKESGVGYSIYKVEDKKMEHLLGYVSHRLGDGKFSVQISRFCEGKQCVFAGLNPEQNREGKK